MKLKAGIFQFAPEHLEPEQNLEKVVRALDEAADQGAELVLLPELWSCGLLENRKQAVEQAAASRGIIDKLLAISDKRKIFSAGSLPEMDKNGRVFNTLFVAGPGSFLERYRKIHLFPLLNEGEIFEPGEHARDIWIETSRGKIGLGCIICYDLRFPDLARILALRGVDILICSALWPAARREAFETLLKARAMENQCFLLASNACQEVAGVEFAGSSRMICPDGRILFRMENKSGLNIKELDTRWIHKSRKSFFSAVPPSGWAFHTEEKILDIETLGSITKRRKKAGQRMVFTNGCFDIIHAGHVSYLKRARLLGDFLVVGMNSDSSVRSIKGEGRPVNPQEQRASVLSALAFVDYVVIFDEDTPRKIIQHLVPDVLVKGADWAENEIVGADFVKSHGGSVHRIKFDVHVSTTQLIERLRKKE